MEFLLLDMLSEIQFSLVFESYFIRPLDHLDQFHSNRNYLLEVSWASLPPATLIELTWFGNNI